MNKYIKVRNKSGSISFLFEKRVLFVTSVLILSTLLLVIMGLSIGSTMINPVTVLEHIIGQREDYTFIIETLRFPRIVLALLVGGALGVSGLIMQGIIRNPLGSPDIIGVTGGASLSAVIFITFYAGTYSIEWLPFIAITGAFVTALLIYVLSYNKGITVMRLVLIGIGISAALSALITMMLVIGNEYSTAQAYLWLTGSVYGATWDDVFAMLPWVLIFIPLTLFFSKTADAFELGDSIAIGLGVKLQLKRLILLIISVTLAGSAVAYAGGIGFVGLIAPHISRKLIGRSFGGLVFVSAIVGGLIVFLADVIARTAFLPLDLPAGIFVSGIGAPFFIYLLYKDHH
ncbi:FecCD family ABC transporter permease [Haloplasma contractile]|uniref:Iron dicitrate transport system permease protein fecD n=1 Tax=Haloplasma contractile SSD-17B TaxID=1033810 RepID=U2FKA4_9MOLU|nr:iron ABC transporter permease [Haloplasma contractile]ERJ13245.1 Iron dicitrate transport system permease protein fecD [Haloplasma contractile SSD-17B]